jgi:hypothetical protein
VREKKKKFYPQIQGVTPLLLDVLPELHKSPCFLVELGLYLTDLLELCVLTPCRD